MAGPNSHPAHLFWAMIPLRMAVLVEYHLDARVPHLLNNVKQVLFEFVQHDCNVGIPEVARSDPLKTS
jgi:hypothetical protein